MKVAACAGGRGADPVLLGAWGMTIFYYIAVMPRWLARLLVADGALACIPHLTTTVELGN